MTTKQFFQSLIEKYVSDPLKREIAEQYSEKVHGLLSRIESLENRTKSYYRNRFEAIDSLADYLVGAQVPGDYGEFGVYQGTVFSYAYKVMSDLFPDMAFCAFDSFEGLPAPSGIDCANTYSSGFHEGQFECSLDDFSNRLKHASIDMGRVRIVKGWFDQVLSADLYASHGISRFAAAWIDCDLYESTVPVLDFVTTRLSTGSVILFDDWRCFRNLPDFGQQRACTEWLSANRHITLNALFSFGWHGIAFSVNMV